MCKTLSKAFVVAVARIIVVDKSQAGSGKNFSSGHASSPTLPERSPGLLDT
jgi:hypothetical protein